MNHHVDLVTDLVAARNCEQTLFRGSRDTLHVQALQRLLYELGFGKELKWQRYGADGDYGNATASAVLAFAGRNGLEADGEAVSLALASAMLDRRALIEPLGRLQEDLAAGRVEEKYHRGVDNEAAVSDLQTLLNGLGYGMQLGWSTYGADGLYGAATARALRAFAGTAGLSTDGNRLSTDLARQVAARAGSFLGDGWASALAEDRLAVDRTDSGLKIEERVETGKTRVYVSGGDQTRRFTRFRRGLVTLGEHDPRRFVEENRTVLSQAGLTDSAINVMISVSDNEGCLDAINTWDNAFLSFGMFQWTAGTAGARGELPALLRRLKQGYSEAFERHFGRWDLDIVNTGTRTGYFSLKGVRLDTAGRKEVLRTPEWAFRFCVAGSDPLMQRVEVEHAIARLDTFYTASGSAVRGHLIADLISSEYGVALLLDNHVNRPGYVTGCLERALAESGLGDPATWGDEQEGRLLQIYVQVRRTYGRSPMTDADKRAEVTRGYVARGVISDRRGSFILHPGSDS